MAHRSGSPTTTQPKRRPTPKRTKPALQRRSEQAGGPVVVPHEIRGRRLSAEKLAYRRHAAKIAKRQRKINRPRAKRSQKLVPLLWLLAAMVLVGGAAGLTAPPAGATTYGAPLHVSATWIGGNCWDRTATKPDDFDQRHLAQAFVLGCRSTTVDTQFVTRGDYFGIDPHIGDAFAVSCTVTNTANGRIVATDYASKGNSHNATCLGRWSE